MAISLSHHLSLGQNFSDHYFILGQTGVWNCIPGTWTIWMKCRNFNGQRFYFYVVTSNVKTYVTHGLKWEMSQKWLKWCSDPTSELDFVHMYTEDIMIKVLYYGWWGYVPQDNPPPTTTTTLLTPNSNGLCKCRYIEEMMSLCLLGCTPKARNRELF